MKSSFNLKRFLFVNIGVILVAVGLHFFLVPNSLAVGGTSGLSIEINHLFPFIPVPYILTALNTILVVIGFIFIGADFGFYTVYASISLGVFLRILEVIVPLSGSIVEGDIFINLIFGIFIQAVGIGIVVNQGASTGGTDIVAKIVETYTRFSFGQGLIMSDGVVTVLAALLYGPKLGMYALLGAFINSTVIDRMIAGFDTKYHITIVTKKVEEINQFILVDLYRGSTLYEAKGGYQKEDRTIIVTVVNKSDYVKLKEFIRKTDKDAFMYVSNVTEVEGYGFTYE
ncbi:YitT family protein [Peptoniphilus sp.]|uniref:YitT family protein n=1 Tax=Peptoniphilus sp. TaxID=1971214 RepID=UPI0039930BC2